METAALLAAVPPKDTKPPRAYVDNNATIAFEQGFNAIRFGRHGPIIYNENDQFVGRSIAEYGEYNHDEFELLSELVHPHTCVIEIGANIGTHTIPLAQRAAMVYAFEPQRLVYQVLAANIALNQLTNVFAWQAALSDVGGRAFMPELNPRAPHNFGGVSMQTEPTSEAVMQLVLDDIGIAQCGLLKIDVEGMELEVLKGAHKLIMRHRPYIYVENDRREKSAALISYLQQELGYTLHWHLPPLYNPNNHAKNPNNVFPNIVSVNMLCLPRSDMDSFGLRRVKGADDSWQ